MAFDGVFKFSSLTWFRVLSLVKSICRLISVNYLGLTFEKKTCVLVLPHQPCRRIKRTVPYFVSGHCCKLLFLITNLLVFEWIFSQHLFINLTIVFLLHSSIMASFMISFHFWKYTDFFSCYVWIINIIKAQCNCYHD